MLFLFITVVKGNILENKLASITIGADYIWITKKIGYTRHQTLSTG